MIVVANSINSHTQGGIWNFKWLPLVNPPYYLEEAPREILILPLKNNDDNYSSSQGLLPLHNCTLRGATTFVNMMLPHLTNVRNGVIPD